MRLTKLKARADEAAALQGEAAQFVSDCIADGTLTAAAKQTVKQPGRLTTVRITAAVLHQSQCTAAAAAGVRVDDKRRVQFDDGTYPTFSALRKAVDSIKPARSDKGKPMIFKLGDTRMTREQVLARLNGDARIVMTADERDAVMARSLDDCPDLTSQPYPADPDAAAPEADFLTMVRTNLHPTPGAEAESLLLDIAYALNEWRALRERLHAELEPAVFTEYFHKLMVNRKQREQVHLGTAPATHRESMRPQLLRDSCGPAYADQLLPNNAGAEFRFRGAVGNWHKFDNAYDLPAPGARSWRNGQEDVVAHVLGGAADTVAVLPVGFGKSLTFMHPVSIEAGNGAVTVIVAPTNRLKAELLQRFREDYPHVAVTQFTADEKGRVPERIAGLLAGQIDCIIVSPEHLIPAHPVYMALVALGRRHRITRFVWDEAHTLESWQGFRNAVLILREALSIPAFDYAQRCLFSATITRTECERLCHDLHLSTNTVHFLGDPRRENIVLSTQQHSTTDLTALHQQLRRLAMSGKKALVFIDRIKVIDSLLPALNSPAYGLTCRAYHSGMTRLEQDEAEEWFRSTSGAVLLATTALSVGVNFDELDTVIVTYIPNDLGEAIQLAGRAGRNGQPANALLMFTQYELDKCAKRCPELAALYAEPDSASMWRYVAGLNATDWSHL